MKVSNIFMTKNYDIADEGKIPIIKKWLGREGLYFLQTSIAEKHESVKNHMAISYVI